MSTSYKLSVNNTSSFDLNESDLKNLDAVSVENNKFHVLKDHKPYKAEIISADLSYLPPGHIVLQYGPLPLGIIINSFLTAN